MRGALVVALAVVLTATCAGVPGAAAGPVVPGPLPCPSFGPTTQVGTVPDSAWFDEVSGVVESRTSPGVLWAIADSGNAPEVVALDHAGTELARFDLAAGATNVDWEDLAVGPGPGGDDHLFVADVGDNQAVRSSVTVYRLPEPAVQLGDALGTVAVPAEQVDALVATYPDGAHDAEALLADPRTGDLVVVTKVLFGTRGYVLGAPHGAGPTEMLAGPTVAGPFFVTGGDVSPGGDQVLLRTYAGAHLWHRDDGESLVDAMAAGACSLPVADPGLVDTQGEAIAFANGTGYLTISERAGAEAPQPIWLADSCELPDVPPNDFPDVADLFDPGVSWMSCFGITTGYGDGTFRPAGSSNRQQVAAFLHRFFDRPSPSTPVGFPDVGDGHAFAEPIAWLAQSGITTGYADGTFGPDRTVTRAQAAAFLHRAAGRPEVSGGGGFTDVPASSPFHAEIVWMAQQEISTGWADGTFRPNQAVSRGALAAFLHRLATTPGAWADADVVPSPVLF